ncbi:hypothetical protein [Mesorhizobium sp. YM1C-6-2]|uniref:hypothetical protein n=1 Tax=Mesorhizobium sp. YM1C-6-2 TaxID=1827501 RepID=UPI0032AF00CE
MIVNDLTVEQSAAAWPVFRIAPEAHSFPFEYSTDDLAALGTLVALESDDPEGRLGAWAQAFIHGTPQIRSLC